MSRYQSRYPYRTWIDITGPKHKTMYDTGCTKLAAAIRESRKNKYLTQEKFAEKIGVGRSQLAQWETAKRPVMAKDLAKLETILPAAVIEKIETRPTFPHGNACYLPEAA